MPGSHLRLLTWEDDDSSEEPDVHLCRECDALLWHRHECCPSCRARRPHARMPVLTLTGAGGRLAAVVAVAAPVASAAVDQALHWLLVAV